MISQTHYYERPRTYLADILNAHGLIGIGVEIGVKKGDFSKHILQNWNCKQYFLVDPWCEQDKQTYDEECHNFSQDYIDCLTNLQAYKNKYKIIRDYSHNAHKSFKDETFDFIYIDGNHSYEAVLQDLNLWYPKLKKNGLISGDDYTIKSSETVFNSQFGVKQAVDEFALKVKRNVSIDLNGDWFYNLDDKLVPCRNWYFIK